jgi:hypothetical protein
LSERELDQVVDGIGLDGSVKGWEARLIENDSLDWREALGLLKELKGLIRLGEPVGTEASIDEERVFTVVNARCGLNTGRWVD